MLIENKYSPAIFEDPVVDTELKRDFFRFAETLKHERQYQLFITLVFFFPQVAPTQYLIEATESEKLSKHYQRETLAASVSRMRQKLSKYNFPLTIQTQQSMGFRLEHTPARSNCIELTPPEIRSLYDFQRHSSTRKLFSEELNSLSHYHQMILKRILKHFPDPTPTASLMEVVNTFNKVKSSTLSKQVLDVIIKNIRKKLKSDGFAISIRTIFDYGYELSHPDIKPTWWAQLTDTQRKIFAALLEDPTLETPQDIFNTIHNSPDHVLTDCELNAVTAALARLRKQLNSIFPEYPLPQRKLFKEIVPLFQKYPKESLLSDLKQVVVKQSN